MDSGSFFIVAGVVVIVLWSAVLPSIDRLGARRSRPESHRRSDGWQRFQKTNTRQGIAFGIFLILLGVLTR